MGIIYFFMIHSQLKCTDIVKKKKVYVVVYLSRFECFFFLVRVNTSHFLTNIVFVQV